MKLRFFIALTIVFISLNSFAFVMVKDNAWDQGQELKIHVFKDQVSKADVQIIYQALREWRDWVNLEFKVYLEDSTRQFFSHIRIGEIEGDDGCWSAVGKDSLNTPANEVTLNLGCFRNADYEAKIRTIRHEFGHALGIQHEHQNPSIPFQFIDEEIYDFCRYNQKWSDERCFDNILKRLEESYDSDELVCSDFDPESIMLYTIYGHQNNKGHFVKAQNDLSRTDVQFIKKVYPRTEIRETQDIFEAIEKNSPTWVKRMISRYGNPDEVADLALQYILGGKVYDLSKSTDRYLTNCYGSDYGTGLDYQPTSRMCFGHSYKGNENQTAEILKVLVQNGGDILSAGKDGRYRRDGGYEEYDKTIYQRFKTVYGAPSHVPLKVVREAFQLMLDAGFNVNATIEKSFSGSVGYRTEEGPLVYWMFKTYRPDKESRAPLVIAKMMLKAGLNLKAKTHSRSKWRDGSGHNDRDTIFDIENELAKDPVEKQVMELFRKCKPGLFDDAPNKCMDIDIN